MNSKEVKSVYGILSATRVQTNSLLYLSVKTTTMSKYSLFKLLELLMMNEKSHSETLKIENLL